MPLNMNSEEGNNALSRHFRDMPGVGSRKDNEHRVFMQRKMLQTKQRLAESRSKGMNCNSSTDADRFPTFVETFSGDLPCPLFYIDKHSVKLQKFKNFNQLSDFLLGSEKNIARDRHVDANVLTKLCSRSIKYMAHFSTLGDYLRHLYEKDHLMDVNIDVDGEIFKAHKIALCCFSGYFSDLFLGQKQHNNVPTGVKLVGISAHSFATFLEFVYTGEISINPDTAADVLITSEFLGVDELRNRVGALVDRLSLAQTVKIFVKCRHRASNQLYHILVSQILWQFSAAAMLPGFLDMDVETFCFLLSSDDLFVSREFEVFQVALRWIVHGGHARLTHVLKVVNLIRFCHMTPGELLDCVEETHLFLEYGDLRELVLIANWIITTVNLGRRDLFQFPVWTQRVGYTSQKTTVNNSARDDHQRDVPHFQKQRQYQTKIKSPKSIVTSKTYGKPVLVATEMISTPVRGHTQLKKFDIFVIGGFQHHANDKDYNNPKSWMKQCSLPSPRIHHTAVLVSGNIYIIGGTNSVVPMQPMKLVRQMNVKRQKWYKMADMSDARMGHCACAVNGKIYVFGGIGVRNRVLSTAECYDTVLDTWSYIAMMTTPRFAASAATLGTVCYVTGGMLSDDEHTVDKGLDLVECYDPSSNSWSTKSRLNRPRFYASLVHVNQTLYLCGGATYSQSLNGLLSEASIEVYNASTDTWTHLTNMTIPRHGAGVAVTGRRMYIVGGISSPTEQVLQSVECFDTADSKWLPEVEDLPVPAKWIRCISVPQDVK